MTAAEVQRLEEEVQKAKATLDDTLAAAKQRQQEHA